MGTQPPEQFENNVAQFGNEAEQQECFVLKWSDYHHNVAESFKIMRADGDFLDTTLACSGSEQLQAHRVVLSAFSPYLKGMLRNNPAQHPTLVMPENVQFLDLHSLLEFMYHGEVRVPADSLESLMALAKLLKVKGLTEENDVVDDESANKSDPNVMRRPDSNKGGEPHRKRKRMTSSSTLASESNDDDYRVAHPHIDTSNIQSQPNYPQNGPTASNNDFMSHSIESSSVRTRIATHPQQVNSATFDSNQPGGSSGGEAMAGSGIKLTGLLCPQCRIRCNGVIPLKEHMAAAHGILNSPPAPTQTRIQEPNPVKSGNETPNSNRAWNTPNMQEQINHETAYEQPETFYCKLCPKEKVKPFTSQHKLQLHEKRVHRDDLEEDTLQQAHEGLNSNEDSREMPSPLPQQDANFAAQRHANVTSGPTSMNKRGGRGSSIRGRSPAVNRNKKGIMSRSENVPGGTMEVERRENESRYAEFSAHKQGSHVGDRPGSKPSGNTKLEGLSTDRTIDQVSPALRNNHNVGVSSPHNIKVVKYALANVYKYYSISVHAISNNMSSFFLHIATFHMIHHSCNSY